MGGIDVDPDALRELFRTDPVGTGLFVLGPVALAAAQLSNSLLNDLSLAVSVPFAVVLLAFSGLLVQYQLARHRLRELDALEAVAYPAD